MSFIFQQLEVEESIDQNKPIIRLFGVKQDGNSALIHIHNFQPYFYTPIPTNWNHDAHSHVFISSLNIAIKNDNQKYSDSITHVQTVAKQSIYGFRRHKSNFIRVFCSLPQIIPIAKRLLERGLDLGSIGYYSVEHTFESNLSYTLRFMIDCNVVGCNWIEIPQNCYKLRSDSDKVSSCHQELDVRYLLITQLYRYHLSRT